VKRRGCEKPSGSVSQRVRLAPNASISLQTVFSLPRTRLQLSRQHVFSHPERPMMRNAGHHRGSRPNTLGPERRSSFHTPFQRLVEILELWISSVLHTSCRRHHAADHCAARRVTSSNTWESGVQERPSINESPVNRPVHESYAWNAFSPCRKQYRCINAPRRSIPNHTQMEVTEDETPTYVSHGPVDSEAFHTRIQA